MGSYYQPLKYFRGGKRSTRKNVKKGGFYPSVMGGLVGAGKYLIPVALRQGYKLLNSKTRKRRASRKNHK